MMNKYEHFRYNSLLTYIMNIHVCIQRVSNLISMLSINGLIMWLNHHILIGVILCAPYLGCGNNIRKHFCLHKINHLTYPTQVMPKKAHARVIKTGSYGWPAVIIDSNERYEELFDKLRLWVKCSLFG